MTDAERFTVTVTATKAIKGEHIVYRYGLDADGFEVVWTDVRTPWEECARAAHEGATVIVQGHEVMRYSGAYGPWGPGATPSREGDDNAR